MFGSGGIPARRAVARWALRLFRREWRQQVLVMALLTVAVGAAVFAVCAAYNVTSSRDADFGSADHRFELPVSNPEALEPYVAAAERWFDGVDVISHRSVPVPGSTEVAEIRAQDPSGRYGAPMLALQAGRYPAGATEVALTDRLAAIFDVGVDDAIVLDGTEWTVVGLVENPGDLSQEFVLGAPTSRVTPDRVTILVQATDERVDSFTFAEDPGRGFVDSRGETEKETAAVLVLVAATVAMLLVSLVAAAGFVAVAQRRLRQLGMLGAIGATRRHLRIAMLANGVAVGVLAALMGTALALLAWVVAAPSFEGAAGHRIDRLDVPIGLVAIAMLLAVVGAAAAARWPARSMERIPITRALSARPPRPGRSHRSALVAVLLLLGAAACLAIGNNPSKDQVNPLLLVSGVIAAALALLMLAQPAIRALASIGGRAPVAVRLALRDLARYPARSGSALASISLGLAIAVSTVAIAAAREDRADAGNLSDRQIAVWVGDSRPDPFVPDRSPQDLVEMREAVDELVRTLDETAVVPLEMAVDPTMPEPHGLDEVLPAAQLSRPVSETTHRFDGMVFIATPAVLDHLGIDATAVGHDTILLTHLADDPYISGVSNVTFRRNPVPADAVERITTPRYSSTPRSLLTERGLRVAKLQPATAGWLIEADRPFTDDQLADVRDIAAGAGLTIESRDEQDTLATIRTIASVAGVLLALGILAMTVGLIRGESARDVRTLTAAGATTSTRRALAAGTTGALALLGVVLGTTVAYVVLVAGYWPATGRLSNVPAAHLVAIALVLPVVATIAGWLLAGREPGALAHQVAE